MIYVIVSKTTRLFKQMKFYLQYKYRIVHILYCLFPRYVVCVFSRGIRVTRISVSNFAVFDQNTIDKSVILI